ncbi:hypothetical protein KPL71_014205 [Citrus sinensis]|uniref:Uncharacterized protein n=1 Tax=Citrus sinensis TaxID=2711 RepID=A0ACB8KA00_CITSI|nr:hypothetical protein KPL71_014205 [Citrus sinensis]
MALLDGLHSEIIDIRNRMQQLPPGDNGFDISEKCNEIIRLLSEGHPGLDISEFERGREELFDLLIEGPSGLPVVAILDSSGFDKTVFDADTYNNNHVKFYFDCLAWVRVSIAYDFGKILNDIIKSVMPPSRVSVIVGEDYQLKKSVLRDYLTNKKYFIVLDDVFNEREIWDDLQELLPDNQNGSRVLILVAGPGLLTSLEMENGEKIRLHSVLIGGPLIRLKHEAWQFFILHYGSIEISTRQLYQLWVAEGFIPYNGEETAEHYLKELIHRGFIQSWTNIPSLKCLPSLLCTLLNLQTLEMPSSYIDQSPEDIWMMQKLMHLNFGSITLPAPPKNYSSSLKNLIFISALNPSSCTPDILGRLPSVRTLRISGDLSYYQSGVSKSLCELHKLECLKLVNESKPSRMVLSEYQFPPSLIQLSLSNTELMEDPMPILENLPRLRVLKLKQNSYLGRKLACVGLSSFPELKVLHLKSMYWLDEWTMGTGAMPKLESLIVNPCAYLRKLPEELWCIKSLRKLDLHWPQTQLRQGLRTFEDMEWRYDIRLYPYGI